MKPITVERAEADLRRAIEVGDDDAITAAIAVLDRLDVHEEPNALAAALWYAARLGLPVFCCQPGAKVPFYGSRGVKDATTDAAVIRGWFSRCPAANVAVATGTPGGVDVIDFDGRPGLASRLACWDEFAEEEADVLATVSTPRPGGLHWWLPMIPGVRNGQRLLPGVDYRARGGYVLAPPSVLDGREKQAAGTYHFLTTDGLDALRPKPRT